jgi:thioredoxin 1
MFSNMKKFLIMGLLSVVFGFFGCKSRTKETKPVEKEAFANVIEDTTVIKIKDMENFSELIKGNKPTLVDFFATWCGPCQMMHPVLEQLKAELGDSIRIIKVDVDKNEALSAQYRIQSVPTLMIFKDGEIKWRQSGAMMANDLKNVIEQFK